MTDKNSTPQPILNETFEKARQVGIAKTKNPFFKTLLYSILGGMFIGIGAMAATTIGTGLSTALPYGLSRLLMGLIFCVGLILVVIAGAEIFTGNILLVLAWWNRDLSFWSVLRNWGIVYVGNLIGSLLFASLMMLGGQYKFAQGAVGQLMISTATAKMSHSFGSAFFLGVLCNILVCLAIWMTYSCKTNSEKVLVILFPITAFVAAGFEHSVADMYYIPNALFIKIFDPAFIQNLKMDVTSLTWFGFVKLLVPVTLGNLIGGMVFVGLVYFLIHSHKGKQSPLSS